MFWRVCWRSFGFFFLSFLASFLGDDSLYIFTFLETLFLFWDRFTTLCLISWVFKNVEGIWKGTFVLLFVKCGTIKRVILCVQATCIAIYNRYMWVGMTWITFEAPQGTAFY